MSKHTPGPWQVSRDNATTLTIVAPWSDKVRQGCEGWGDYRGIHTATITHHSGDGAVPREHAEANARLIAAAPDLLALAQMVANLGEYRELIDAMANALRPHERAAFVKLFREDARAAIAKATEAA